jgi:hypothetical protein
MLAAIVKFGGRANSSAAAHRIKCTLLFATAATSSFAPTPARASILLFRAILRVMFEVLHANFMILFVALAFTATARRFKWGRACVYPARLYCFQKNFN